MKLSIDVSKAKWSVYFSFHKRCFSCALKHFFAFVTLYGINLATVLGIFKKIKIKNKKVL